MNEHRTPEANRDTFDGDAISRTDREFLANLGNHPLVRHPLYGVPPPPRPNYDGCTTVAERAEAQKACFPAALDWMLVNYAYYAGAFIGKGGIISLVDGELYAIASLSSFMQPYAIVEEGPRGGLSKTSVVDVWIMHPQRAQIDQIQTRSDRPRPVFTEDGYTIFNRYRPPMHPSEGGDIAPFEAFFARLVPDEAERTWFWNYLTHKARRPWVPMVGIIMVAEEFGTGRGTLFDILELLFGEDYVVPCSFGELTGTSSASRFNARLADALIAVVNEAIAEDGERQAQRRLNYEALKNSIDPSPARRRYEAKGQHAYAQRSAMSAMIATNHRDVVKLPWNDRRFSVITCGERMTKEDAEKIRAWMGMPENIGALYQALLMTPAVPAEVFDPFGQPPPFAGRREMIGMGKSRLEDAYEAAIDRRLPAVHDDASAEADQLNRSVPRQRRVGPGQAHGCQECLPAARAGRGEQPDQVLQAAGDRLRPHERRAASLAWGRYEDDRRHARSGRGASDTGYQRQRRARRVRRPYARG